ncbi:MAG: hypothetical protein U9R66_03975 [Thermodesulfobacteriota bacterium]|nr:hypothetical protein [Thermodesulfobacteriota bacterium]
MGTLKNDSIRMHSFFKDKDNYLWPLAIIFIGFALRLYSFYHSHAVNSDGMLYIHQAKEFYYGRYGSLTECYPFLNILPIFISFSYRLIGDWLVAAKVVALFFGTATMFPLYLLLRRFQAVPVASCALLVFAVNPILVGLSNEVIRGPACWFFLTLGMCFFTVPDLKKNSFFLPLSCLSYLFAGLARVEAIIFVPGTLIFLLFFWQEKKWQKISIFLSPLVFVGVLAVSSLSMLGFDLSQWLYPRSFWDKFASVPGKYEEIRQGLSEIGSRQSEFWDKFFFPKVRNLLWWLGIGTVLVEIARTFFEPLFLIFIFGFKGIVRRIKEDRMLVYLILLSVGSFLLLNLHVQGHWIMRKRFVAIFLLPSFFLVGFGLENLFSYFAGRFQIRKMYLVLFTGFLIFAVALPKNMSENRVKKKIFQEIGEKISSVNKTNQRVKVVGALNKNEMQFINFFSNLTVENALCVKRIKVRVKPSSYKRNTISKKATKGGNYLVWDEKNWPPSSLESIKNSTDIVFEKRGEWQDARLGRLILFHIR